MQIVNLLHKVEQRVMELRVDTGQSRGKYVVFEKRLPHLVCGPCVPTYLEGRKILWNILLKSLNTLQDKPRFHFTVSKRSLQEVMKPVHKHWSLQGHRLMKHRTFLRSWNFLFFFFFQALFLSFGVKTSTKLHPTIGRYSREKETDVWFCLDRSEGMYSRVLECKATL